MSQAENPNSTNLSRRAALAGLAGAAAGVAALPVTSTSVPAATRTLGESSDDAELIALGRELAVCDAELDRVEALAEGLVQTYDDPRVLEQEAEMGAANEQAAELIDSIIIARPKSIAGLAVMAQAIFYEIGWWQTGLHGEFEGEHNDRLLLHLASAVLKAAGQDPEKPVRDA